MFLQILKIVSNIFLVIVMFNLMIIVHELGHFLAARWRGLVIEKFGIWFGKPLWKKKINGVEYSLGSIPAGGFVALPQLAPMEVMEGKVETPREALPPISALDKIIVAFAGPLFSFSFACLLALLVWQIGRPVSESETTTIVGDVQPHSPAEKAGVQVGDEILEIDGRPVTRWGGMGSDSVMWRVVRSEGSQITVKVRRGNEIHSLVAEPRVPAKSHWWNRQGLRQIGIEAALTPVVSAVTPKSPAARAGLQKGDVITHVDGHRIFSIDGLFDVAATSNLTGPLRLTIERKQSPQEISFDLDPVSIGEVASDPQSPASLAGLQKGDVVLGINGTNIKVATALTHYITAHGIEPFTLNLMRDGHPLDVKITPQYPENDRSEDRLPRIGVAWKQDTGLILDSMGRSGMSWPHPSEQIRASLRMIASTLDAVISRHSSIGIQHMGGPVMMMHAYYNMFQMPEGWRLALWFSVVLNVNLALLNLLPVPVLDGGHITLALIEAIRRRPVNVRLLEYVQTTCALVIIGFMVFIAFFDVQDLPFLGKKGVEMHFRASSENAK